MLVPTPQGILDMRSWWPLLQLPIRRHIGVHMPVMLRFPKILMQQWKMYLQFFPASTGKYNHASCRSWSFSLIQKLKSLRTKDMSKIRDQFLESVQKLYDLIGQLCEASRAVAQALRSVTDRYGPRYGMDPTKEISDARQATQDALTQLANIANSLMLVRY
jgi:hypothetical protein